MSLYDYLDENVLEQDSLNPIFLENVSVVARAWLQAQVEPGVVEFLSEVVARSAHYLRAPMSWEQFEIVLEHHTLHVSIQELLRKFFNEPVEAVALAALAVHLLDIAERMALEMYVAELPALMARSDRSGDAARRVGAARHLKG